MALRHEKEQYTKWMHLENGNVIVRRIHRMQVQAADGRGYVLTGDRLPECVVTDVGQFRKGQHLAQILLKPESIRPPVRQWPEPPVWPNWRDLLHVGIGLVAFALMSVVGSGIAAG